MIYKAKTIQITSGVYLELSGRCMHGAKFCIQVKILMVQHRAACFVLNRPWKEMTGQHH